MAEIPVERRMYFPHTPPLERDRRVCPSCGWSALTPWYLRRDRERRVWRRWVCRHCQASHDLPEDGSA
jgi:hypothetical protein